MKPRLAVAAALVAVSAGFAAGPALAEPTLFDPPAWPQAVQPMRFEATSAVGKPLSLTQEHERQLSAWSLSP
jgi:hypothetical protein